LILSLSRTPVECETFPAGCERSVDGSLRLLPGFPCEVSGGELEVLKAEGLPFRVLIPLPEPPKPAAKAPAKKATKTPAKKAEKKPAKKPAKKAEEGSGE